MSKSSEAETYHHLAKNLKRFDYILAKVIKVSIPPFLSLPLPSFQHTKELHNLVNKQRKCLVRPHACINCSRSSANCLCMAHLLCGLDGACISSLADLGRHMLLCHIAISVVQEGLGFHDLSLFGLWEKEFFEE